MIFLVMILLFYLIGDVYIAGVVYGWLINVHF